jgi:hypothetical protein
MTQKILYLVSEDWYFVSHRLHALILCIETIGGNLSGGGHSGSRLGRQGTGVRLVGRTAAVGL